MWHILMLDDEIRMPAEHLDALRKPDVRVVFIGGARAVRRPQNVPEREVQPGHTSSVQAMSFAPRYALNLGKTCLATSSKMLRRSCSVSELMPSMTGFMSSSI